MNGLCLETQADFAVSRRKTVAPARLGPLQAPLYHLFFSRDQGRKRVGVFDRFRLDGKQAMITGGSRGLGKEMALALAEAGADLLIVGRDQGTLHGAAQEIGQLGHRVNVLVGDVSTPDEATR